ncbi:MAG: 3'-5' exonuclease, partial [Acholeplasmataceae bacterium]|nr:3'-5' exonuclease [Acholeplasmataceae bacterium]
GYKEINRLSLLVKPDNPLPPKIIEITGITDDILKKEGVSQEEAFHQFFNLYTEDALLIAYNIMFDLSFLSAFFKKYWHAFYTFKNDILDAMAIYRDRHPWPNRLENAVAKYFVEAKNTHRAIDDVSATYELLLKMNQELPNLTKYVNVIGYNSKYGAPKMMPHLKKIAQKGGMREIEKS